MIHCDMFSEDDNARYTKFSGSGEQVDIELIEVLFTYMCIRSEYEDASLMDLCVAYHAGKLDVGEEEFVELVKDNIFTTLAPVLDTIVSLSLSPTYINHRASDASFNSDYGSLRAILDKLKEDE